MSANAHTSKKFTRMCFEKSEEIRSYIFNLHQQSRSESEVTPAKKNQDNQDYTSKNSILQNQKKIKITSAKKIRSYISNQKLHF